MNTNITMDFSVNKSLDSLTAGQEMAIMPAALAEKLLKHYATSLQKVRASSIIERHIAELQDAATREHLGKAIEMSISWIQERDLIANVAAGDWDAYKVEAPLAVECA